MTKQIIRVDASALKESSCMLRLYRTVVQGYRAPISTNDMEYGSAFHQFVATMKQTGEMGLAIQAAQKRFDVPMEIKYEKKYLDANHLIETCMLFWETFASRDEFVTLTHDGKPMVEVKFSWPFYKDDDVEVHICGTADDICKHKRGTYAIRDYKTTSVGKVQQYMHGYKLSPQLLTYRLILRYYARAYPTSIFATIENSGCCVFIDGIFLRGKDKDPEFVRSEVEPIAEDKLTEYEELLHKTIRELVALIKSPSNLRRDGLLNGACHTIYGHCKFFNACAAPDDIARDHVLRRNFITKPYDPLSF